MWGYNCALIPMRMNFQCVLVWKYFYPLVNSGCDNYTTMVMCFVPSRRNFPCQVWFKKKSRYYILALHMPWLYFKRGNHFIAFLDMWFLNSARHQKYLKNSKIKLPGPFPRPTEPKALGIEPMHLFFFLFFF